MHLTIIFNCIFYVFAFIITLTATATPLENNKESEQFNEELYIKALPNGFVNTYFQFTTKWHYGEVENLHNTKLVPRAIAEILMQYDVKELHISLAKGLWRYEQWGYPVVDAAPGAEVWAWFAAPNLTTKDVDQQWIHLAGTFSGILCASLNFIDKTNSVEPKYGYRAQFSAGKKTKLHKEVRYASLPREVVCTENLTPWKKLLPCNSNYGFASLLNSGHVHNTHYHSLAIKMRTLCEDYNKNCVLEFTESANFVFDPKLLGQNDFSLRRLFGQGLNGHCALAKSSKIYVDIDNHSYDLNPLPMYNVSSTRGGSTTNYGVYDIKSLDEDRFYNIAWLLRKTEKNVLPILVPPPITAHRFILGYGQEKGKIMTQVTNNHYSSLPIVLQENIPWFVPVYMHTLCLEIISPAGMKREIQPTKIHYIPGIQRKRPYHLEVLFEIPAKSTVQLSLDFDYIFLKWLEYPPDANHGHYLGSATITTQMPIARNYTAVPLEGALFADSFNATRIAYYLEIRTETLILSLPTPDFSMPYNVICLACTVVALAFGPIHSVATKRIVVEQRDTQSENMFKKIFGKLFRKKQISNTENTTTTATTDQDSQEQQSVSNIGHDGGDIMHKKLE